MARSMEGLIQEHGPDQSSLIQGICTPLCSGSPFPCQVRAYNIWGWGKGEKISIYPDEIEKETPEPQTEDAQVLPSDPYTISVALKAHNCAIL
jgi:hypothetical protein